MIAAGNATGRISAALRLRFGFLRSHAPTSSEIIDDLKSSAFRYTEGLRSIPGPLGRYRYRDRPDAPPTLYASVFVALLLHLTGHLESLPVDGLEAWAQYISDHQYGDGLFRDPYVENDIADASDWQESEVRYPDHRHYIRRSGVQNPLTHSESARRRCRL